MAGIASIRIASFLFLATCMSLSQQSIARITKNPLPDAPSIQVSTPERPIEAHGAAAGLNAVHFDSMQVLKYDAVGGRSRTAESKDFFAKYLSSSPLAHNGSYHSSIDDSLIDRATYAASSLVLTHDDDGNRHLNTSYLLRVLTSAVAHSAYRPYWKRHLSQPFSEFGSTIGNDAGMNVFHEFEPGILQLVKTHEPRFVSSIEEHFHHK
jgi:hypothetical protein